MAGRSKYPGVEQRGDALRLWFKYHGKKVHEPHPAPATPAGLAAAARDRAKIVAQIEAGVFDYNQWFPDSPRAAQSVAPPFAEIAERWVHRARSELAKSTLDGYLKKLNPYWMPSLEDRPIDQITAGELKDIAAGLTDIAAKTYNDSLPPLRAVFQTAIDDKIIADNPASSLKFRKRQKPKPDPLTPDEMTEVLAWLSAKEPHWHPYFAFAFDTGLRTSELIALDWKTVDMRSGYITVENAYVSRELKACKTYEQRDVELGPISLQSLRDQRPRTQLVNCSKGNLVFRGVTGDVITGDKPPRLVWTRALRALGIRHRPAYNTRHTFATMAIQAGCNVGWLSKQMGHSSIKMTFDHYATWINRLDRGSERAKLSSLGNNLGNGARFGE